MTLGCNWRELLGCLGNQGDMLGGHGAGSSVCSGGVSLQSWRPRRWRGRCTRSTVIRQIVYGETHGVAGSTAERAWGMWAFKLRQPFGLFAARELRQNEGLCPAGERLLLPGDTSCSAAFRLCLLRVDPFSYVQKSSPLMCSLRSMGLTWLFPPAWSLSCVSPK